MSEIEYSPYGKLPEIPTDGRDVLLEAFVQVLLDDTTPAILQPGKHRGKNGVFIRPQGKQAEGQPVRFERKIRGAQMFAARSDGRDEIVPTGQISCVEMQYGQGFKELLLRIPLDINVPEYESKPYLRPEHLGVLAALAQIRRGRKERAKDNSPLPPSQA